MSKKTNTQEQIIDVQVIEQAAEQVAAEPTEQKAATLYQRCVAFFSNNRFGRLIARVMLNAVLIAAMALFLKLLVLLFGGAISFLGAAGVVALGGAAVAAAGYGAFKLITMKGKADLAEGKNTPCAEIAVAASMFG